jgi:hypothetical protein
MPETLQTGRSVAWPSSSVLLPGGETLRFNGLDQPKRWDGVMSTVENVGVPAATSDAVRTSLSGSGGNMWGRYGVGVQFFDDEGLVGNLSSLVMVTAASAQTFHYGNVPTSSDTRVTGRYLWRTTAGQTRVAYLDATINDNATTQTYSLAGNDTDGTLAARTNLSVLAPDGSVNARRYGQPPDDMRVAAYHFDRAFLCCPAKYSEGHAELTSGATGVTIVGGDLTSQMRGRNFHVQGYNAKSLITAVSPSGSRLTLNTAYADTSDKFKNYSIEPEKGERNKNYWTYANEPESWLSSDAVIPEADHTNEEDQVGMFRFGSFLWLAFPSNIYRWTFTSHPVDGGAIYHTVNRGMLNHRCHAQVPGAVAIMDRQGIYLFNGGTARPISDSIQNYFRDKIVWERREWFFAVAQPDHDTVRFFICLDGSRYPRHALAFNYATGRWTKEEYPWQITSATQAPIAGVKRLLLGAEHEQVLLTGDGTLDGPPAKRPHQAQFTVTSATDASVTIGNADWNDDDIAGVSLAVVSGRGKGQKRRIVASSRAAGTIDVDRPWDTQPDDSTSKVSIGAIEWEIATGSYFLPERSGEGRTVEMLIDPTTYDCNMDLNIRWNNSETAALAAETRTWDAAGGGSSTKDESGVQFDLKRQRSGGEWDGLAMFNFNAGYERTGPANRYVQFDYTGFQVRDPILMRQLEIGGVE